MKLHLTIYLTGRASPITAEIEWNSSTVPSPMELTSYVSETGYLEDETWGRFSWDEQTVDFFAIKRID